MNSVKLAHISELNKLVWFDYQLEAIDEETLLVTGDRGEYNHFRVEMRFMGTAYIACPLYIDLPVHWRLATPDEATAIIQAYNDYYDIPVFCVEEALSVLRPIPKRAPRKSFIVAWKVDITLHYGGDMNELIKEYNLAVEI